MKATVLLLLIALVACAVAIPLSMKVSSSLDAIQESTLIAQASKMGARNLKEHIANFHADMDTMSDEQRVAIRAQFKAAADAKFERDDLCWIHSRFRGRALECATGKEKIGLLCYDPCDAASKSSSCTGNKALVAAGFGCREACPAGTDSTPLVCFGKGLKIFSGSNTRCGYERTPTAQNLAVCTPEESKKLGVCWSECATGSTLTAGMWCQSKCPPTYTECGPLACTKADKKGACAAAITAMVSKVTISGLKITTLFLTFGASAGAPFAMKGVNEVIDWTSSVDVIGLTANIIGLTEGVVTGIIGSINEIEGKKTEAAVDTATAAALGVIKTALSTAAGVNKIASFVVRMLLADDGQSELYNSLKDDATGKITGPSIAKWIKTQGPDFFKEMIVGLGVRIIKELDPTGLVDVFDAFYHPVCGTTEAGHV